MPYKLKAGRRPTLPNSTTTLLAFVPRHAKAVFYVQIPTLSLPYTSHTVAHVQPTKHHLRAPVTPVARSIDRSIERTPVRPVQLYVSQKIE